MLLQDKVTLITGGGRGIGRAAALRFAVEGAQLILAARTRSQVESVAEEVRALGGTAVSIATDIKDEANVKSLIGGAIEKFGQLDILVNNAASAGEPMMLVDTPMEKWDETFAVTIRSTVMCSKYALEHMIPKGQGIIINNSSRAGRMGQARRTDYSPAKAAVISFTHALAREVATQGIRVNCVVPGAIDTESLQGFFRGEAKRGGITEEQAREAYKVQAGTQRIPTAEDVAEVMLFLASDTSVGIHGQCVDINGGSWMS